MLKNNKQREVNDCGKRVSASFRSYFSRLVRHGRPHSEAGNAPTVGAGEDLGRAAGARRREQGERRADDRRAGVHAERLVQERDEAEDDDGPARRLSQSVSVTVAAATGRQAPSSRHRHGRRALVLAAEPAATPSRTGAGARQQQQPPPQLLVLEVVQGVRCAGPAAGSRGTSASRSTPQQG